MEQKRARLYALIDEVYRDRDVATREEISRTGTDRGLGDALPELEPLPDGPIPRTALAIAVDRIVAGATGPAIWEGKSNPEEVANWKEPEGGAKYRTDEVGTAGAVEQTGTEKLPVKMRGFPSVENDRPVPSDRALIPMVDLSPEDIDLLSGRHFAHLATLLPDGSPHTVVVWVDVADGLVEVNATEDSAVVENVSRDPRVAVSIHDEANPYRMISVQGTVTQITDQGADEHLRRLAHKYGDEGRYPAQGRVKGDSRLIIRIRPDRIARYGY
jgi:PPOX class probable F420-dependent enzyme